VAGPGNRRALGLRVVVDWVASWSAFQQRSEDEKRSDPGSAREELSTHCAFARDERVERRGGRLVYEGTARFLAARSGEAEGEVNVRTIRNSKGTATIDIFIPQPDSKAKPGAPAKNTT